MALLVGPPRELAFAREARPLRVPSLRNDRLDAEVPASRPFSGPSNSGGAPVVYTTADLDIVPAVLIYPQLPSVPPRHLRNNLSVLDIIVNESGQVHRVKLVSIVNRLNDRMMVSAAKAWRFSPALRNGQPVKYRIQVPLTQ